MEHKISIFIVTLLVLAESAFAADAPPMSEPIQLQVDSKVSLYPDSIGFFDEHPANLFMSYGSTVVEDCDITLMANAPFITSLKQLTGGALSGKIADYEYIFKFLCPGIERDIIVWQML